MSSPYTWGHLGLDGAGNRQSEWMASAMRSLMAQLSKNTESRVREILIDMRESGQPRRYLLIADLETTCTHIEWTAEVSIWASDSIPDGFSGTAMELTQDALAAAYELIDGEAGR